MQYVLSLVSQCFAGGALNGGGPEDGSAYETRGEGGEGEYGTPSSGGVRDPDEECISMIYRSVEEVRGCDESDPLLICAQRVLELLPSDGCRAQVVSVLLTSERKKRRGEAKKRLLHSIFQTQAEARATQVAEMLRDIPPAALGDEEAREETRVLVDLTGDARSSMAWQRKQAAHGSACERTSQVIAELQQRYERSHGGVSHEEDDKAPYFLAALAATLPPLHLERIVLQQLLLSRYLSSALHERERFIEYLLCTSP